MLKLYKGILPNTSDTHYYFDDFNKYLSFLRSKLIKDIKDDNYRINNERCIVKLDTVITTSNYNQITYIINTNDQMCYHVKNAKVQSGCVYYDLSIDYWSSYIAKTHFDKINVLKCNRKLNNNGIYDEIKATTDWFYEDKTKTGIFDDEVAIVFALKYNVKQSSFEARSTVSLFALRLYDIKDLMVDKKAELGEISSVSLAIDFVGGIYGVGGSLGDLNATVLNAWLIPNRWVNKYWQTNVTIKSRGVFVADQDLQITTHILKPEGSYEYISFKDLDPNKDYIMGGFNNGIRIIKTCDNKANICFGYSIGTSDVHVFVAQGNMQQDITSSFQVSVATNDGNIIGLNKVAQYIRMGATAISSGLSIWLGAESGGGAGALAIGKGIGKVGSQVASLLDKKFNTNLVGGGDGTVTFWKGQVDKDDHYVRDYVKINYATSLIDETVRARKTGVNFNTYVDTIDEIFTKDFVGTGTPNDDTFVIAMLKANEIPFNAKDVIESKFSSGVYLQLL